MNSLACFEYSHAFELDANMANFVFWEDSILSGTQCYDFLPQFFQKHANNPVEQPTGSIACNMLANHWIDTFFWGKNKALSVWKRLKEPRGLNCIWPEDLANSAAKKDAAFVQFMALTMKVFFLLILVTLIVCCKTGMCY